MRLPSVITLAWRSLWARRFTAILTILSIAMATLLFLSVENLRQGAKASFERTISGTDLIVGARSSPINLVLYSVFQIGDPTNNVSWDTVEEISERSDVDWIVPISLGDSHRSYRVVGTTTEYFERYKYADGQALSFRDGVVFDDLFDVVIGAQVARDLGYSLDQSITLSHGLGDASFVEHSNTPFRISGVLEPTGTPVDRSVIVSLGAIEAIHAGWQNGVPTPASRVATPERLRAIDFQPESITALLIGTKSRIQILRLQRDLNTYSREPLQAVIPGVALSQLWNIVSVVERALSAVSVIVIIVGLIGILTSILTTLNERRREMSILRSVGARGRTILGLLVSEAALLAGLGALLGMISLYILIWILGPMVEARYGFTPSRMFPGLFDLGVVAVITLASALLGLLPAYRAMKRSVADGLSVRI